jgi:hypothetical protein
MKYPRETNSGPTTAFPEPLSRSAKDSISRAALQELYRPLKVCVICDEILSILDEDEATVIEPEMIDIHMRMILSGVHIQPPLPMQLREQYVAHATVWNTPRFSFWFRS